MKKRFKLFYAIIFFILLTIAIPTIIYTYLGIHPLRHWYLLLFKIGLILGCIRSVMLIKTQDLRARNLLRKYGIFILFITTYFAIKLAIRTFENYELTHIDTLIVMSFFIMGLLLTNFGIYSYYLWKRK